MQLRVLVFDDEECIRYMLDAMLTGEGCEVITFDDPTSFPLYLPVGCACDSALACADVLVCDIYMPRVNGIQFIEGLKKAGCTIPCMALMSGNWTAADLDKAAKLGVYIFEKPFTMSDMRVWLEGCRKKISPGRILCDKLRSSQSAAHKKAGARRPAGPKHL